jgi:ribosomal protein S20
MTGTTGGDISRSEEAKNLAKEAVEAIQHGDKDEGKFLSDAAKELDPSAASQVLKDGTGEAKK